jgi:deazaflavin-dependent oxidoreductase (nitroreductase family)
MQRRLINPIVRQLPGTLLETVGRKSGQPRRTPVGGSVVGNQFWMVSEHGEQSQYVRNIKANPNVRVRIRGRWRTGTAHLLHDDDPHARLQQLPKFNSGVVRAMSTDLLTIRVDLD